MNAYLSAEDKKDLNNGFLFGTILTVIGAAGALTSVLPGFFNGSFPPASNSLSFGFGLTFWLKLFFALFVIGAALLCLSFYVKHGLIWEAAIAPAASDTPSPLCALKTNRGLLKVILLSLITFDIYALVVMSGISTDINIIASRYDKKKTMSYLLIVFIFSWLTLGIVPLIWYHRLCDRIGSELARRGIPYALNAKTFWLWGVLGSLIVVGPFIFIHKLLKSMNLLCQDYNQNG